MHKLLIATQNPGKIIEITNFLTGLPVQLLSLKDVGITDDMEETGETYKENSQAKALFYSKKSGLPAVADDGGLEISALNGAPGIHFRRWLGYKATDEELINHLKKVAKELPETNRNASFKTVVSFCLPNGKVWSVQGEVKGIIAKKPLTKILKGYPYRSFFFLPKLNKYYHESDLSPEEQKLYNHRYIAIQKLKPIIKRELLTNRNPAMKKPNFKIIFIHGHTASSKSDWYPNIAKQLKKLSVDFIVPDLPGGEYPHATDWINIIHQTVKETDKPIVLVGHSLGTRAALIYLEKYKPKLKAVFLIAAFANNGANSKRKNERYADFFENKINIKQIKSLAEKFIVMHSKDDSSIDYQQGVQIAKDLKAKLLTYEGRDHFSEPENAPLIFEILRNELQF